MKRTDSGFHESILSNALHNESTPTRRRRPRKTLTGSSSSTQPIIMEAQQPGSEHPPRTSHQRSSTSSSRDSTVQSRGRHAISSKPCSRGTSRATSHTAVDPTRPSRHYRMQSSHTVPTVTSRDIDDPVALHFRSCSLFQNPSYHAHAALPSPNSSQQGPVGRQSIASRFTDDLDVVENHDEPEQSEEAIPKAERTSTTIHWTSPSTRQQEYKRIDKANSGIRGFMNKVMPRCVSGPQEKFYEKDQSDAGSVRRYRLDETEDANTEKSPLRSKVYDTRESPSVTKKKWACF